MSLYTVTLMLFVLNVIISPLFVNGLTYNEHTRWTANSKITINEKLIISPNASLIVEKGVSVIIGPNIIIQVDGLIRVEGTVDAPVEFKCSNENSRWLYIELSPLASDTMTVNNTLVQSSFNNMIIRNAGTSVASGSIMINKPKLASRIFYFNNIVIEKSGGIEAIENNKLILTNCTLSSDTLGAGYGVRANDLNVYNSSFDGYSYGIYGDICYGCSNTRYFYGNTFKNTAHSIQASNIIRIEKNLFIFPSDPDQNMVAIQGGSSKVIINDNIFLGCRHDTIIAIGTYDYISIQKNMFMNCTIYTSKSIFSFPPYLARPTVNIFNNLFENIQSIGIADYAFLQIGSSPVMDINIIGNIFRNIMLPASSVLIQILNPGGVVVSRNRFEKIHAQYYFYLPAVSSSDFYYVDGSMNYFVDLANQSQLYPKVNNYNNSKYAYMGLFPAYFGVNRTEEYMSPQYTTNQIITGSYILPKAVNVNKPLIYEAGSSVTIEPGTIVNLTAALVILGELIVNGTADQPVVISGTNGSGLYLGSTIMGTEIDPITNDYKSGTLIKHVNLTSLTVKTIMNIILVKPLLLQNIHCDLVRDKNQTNNCIEAKQLPIMGTPKLDIRNSSFRNSRRGLITFSYRQPVAEGDSNSSLATIVRDSVFTGNIFDMNVIGIYGIFENNDFNYTMNAWESLYGEIKLQNNRFNSVLSIIDNLSNITLNQNIFNNASVSLYSVNAIVTGNLFNQSSVDSSLTSFIFKNNTFQSTKCSMIDELIHVVAHYSLFVDNMIKKCNCSTGVVGIYSKSSTSNATTKYNNFANNTVATNQKLPVALFQTDLANHTFSYNVFNGNNNVSYFFNKKQKQRSVYTTMGADIISTTSMDLTYNFWGGLKTTCEIREKMTSSEDITFQVIPFFISRNISDPKNLKCNKGQSSSIDCLCPVPLASFNKIALIASLVVIFVVLIALLIICTVLIIYIRLMFVSSGKLSLGSDVLVEPFIHMNNPRSDDLSERSDL
jgi:hypothetical protein